MDPTFVIVLVVVFGLIFDLTNGFHDASMIVSGAIATKAMRPFTAILMAGSLNFLGATHISGVAKTITSGLVRPEMSSELMVLAALLGAIIWNLVTWKFAIPSSSSFALIGGLIGGGIYHAGMHTVIWKGVFYKVIVPMIFTPLIGYSLAYVMMKILYLVVNEERRPRLNPVFRSLQVVSSGLVSIAHGMNDAQKSMGIITLGLFTGGLIATPAIPLWVIFACALFMGVGTAVGGQRMIRTTGFGITSLSPIQGCASDISSASVILGASYLGMPVSSTQMIVSSNTGVGSAKEFSAVSWKLISTIVYAWGFTLPGSAIFAALTYKLMIWIGIPNI